MRIATISAAAATLLVSTGVAFALDSSVTMTSSMSPDALWKKIGDFCGIAAWHPAIEKCVLSPDGKQRTLTIKGGGVARRGRLSNLTTQIAPTLTRSFLARYRQRTTIRRSAFRPIPRVQQ